MSKKAAKIIIGRKDKIDLPNLDLFNIDAKIDTGAYTSSIHCNNLEVIYKSGRKKIRFHLLDPSHPNYEEKEFLLPILAEKRIRNSFGQVEDRFIIRTKILIYDQIYIIDLSLSDRSQMDYPVLLGRKLLHNRFIVDVTRYDLSYSLKLKQGKLNKETESV